MITFQNCIENFNQYVTSAIGKWSSSLEESILICTHTHTSCQECGQWTAGLNIWISIKNNYILKISKVNG